MDTKQLLLLLSAWLAYSSVDAQPIQFSNGDILEVEVKYQTDKAITFSHAILGEQTINKAKIRNLQALNLERVYKFTEAELNGLKIIKGAKTAVAVAKEGVIDAEEALVSAKDVVDNAEEKNKEIAEEKHVLAADKLTVAQEKVTAAEDNLQAVKDTVAKEQVTVGQEQIVRKAKLDIAEENVEIAEEKVEVAEQQVEVAEENLKLAKEEKFNDGLLGTGWFKGWDSNLSIGLSGSSGASVNGTFRTAFNTRYEDKKGRWDYKSFYFRDSEDNITGENQINATLVKDWFFEESKWFAFATGVYDWNQFKDWNHRLQFGGGPGYKFIKTPIWEFSGRMGATVITEFGKTQFDSVGNDVGEETAVGLEGSIGADVTWHITSKQHFSISNYFYSSLTDTSQFRNLTNISWIHSLDWPEGLALKFGIRNEYDISETIPNEFNYNFSILWGF